eukprot:4770238-Pyramimonas_sp.AAC.1
MGIDGTHQSFGSKETVKQRLARKAALAAEDERTSVTWRKAWCDQVRAPSFAFDVDLLNLEVV